MFHPLILITFFPLVGVLLLLVIHSEQKSVIRWTAWGTSFITFGLGIWVLLNFNLSDPSIQMAINQPWVQSGRMTVTFQMGVDGLSLIMVLLTVFLTPLALLSSWKAIQERLKQFMILFLLLEVGMIGVFLAQDLVLFYIFWEFTLVPAYLLVGMWGGERRIYAAVKFFIFTMAGSVVMLLAILYLGLNQGTFSISWLAANHQLFSGAQTWLFLAFALAFAVKAPIFPLHTWLPDTYTEAPAAVTVILAGILSKLGAYGFLRLNLPLFPQASAQFAPWIGALAVIGILYGAIVAYYQVDMKRLIAYSSISHLGFIILGIFAMNPQGVTGAALQMVNHGLSTGALFLIAGFLEERRGSRIVSDFGGVWKVMPWLGGIALVVVLSSVGLPGLNGFVGELTILLGAFGSSINGFMVLAVGAALGVILAAVYLLRLFENVFLGKLFIPANNSMPDLQSREAVLLAPILLFIFWIGLYPYPFLSLLNPTMNQLSSVVLAAAGMK